MSQAASLGSIQKTVWDGKLPLEIVLAPSESRTYDQTDPYLVCFFSTSKVEMGADIFLGCLLAAFLFAVSSSPVEGVFLFIFDRPQLPFSRWVVLIRERPAEMALPSGPALRSLRRC